MGGVKITKPAKIRRQFVITVEQDEFLVETFGDGNKSWGLQEEIIGKNKLFLEWRKKKNEEITTT